MNSSTDSPKAQALADADAWWTGKPFPRDASGQVYTCGRCGSTIWRREGTALVDAGPICAACAEAAFGTATLPASAAAATANTAPTDGYVQPDAYAQPGGYVQPGGYPQPGAYGQPGGPITGPMAPLPPTQHVPQRTGPAFWRRTWFLITAAVVVVALVAGAGLLIWAPWKPPSPPTGLAVSATTPTSVTLSWSARSTGTPVATYVVLRDGKEVASVPETQRTYQDKDLLPGASHSYAVLAARGDKRSPKPSASVTGTTTTPAPTALKQSDVTTNSVTLSWAAPADAPSPDRYEIYVDGVSKGAIGGPYPAGGPTYTVSGLAYSSTFHFTVKAVWAAGGTSGASEEVQATTKTPELVDARLDYTDGVPVNLTLSSSNLKAFHSGQKITDTWYVTPSCATGPCDVVLNGTLFGGNRFSINLKRQGSTYSGEIQDKLTTCRGKDVQDTLSVSITVKSAGGTNWTAGQLEGDISLASPYTSADSGYYCPAGKTAAHFTAGATTSGTQA